MRTKSLQRLVERYPQKRILITGATSGLGEALALKFAGAGFRVAVASRNPEKVARTVAAVNRAGGEGLPITLDVVQEEQFRTAVEAVEQAWSGLDILVNNAGVLTAGKFEDLAVEVWQQSLQTDLWSVIHGCRHFLPLLKRSGGGHIVNVASAAGFLAGPEATTYCVAKAAAVSLSECLHVELARDHIDVTVSCPTVFRSNLMNPKDHEGDVVEGAGAAGLRRQFANTSVSSDDVADSLITAMAKRRLFDVPQLDAKLSWWFARAAPEFSRRLLLYLYRHKLWLYRDK